MLQIQANLKSIGQKKEVMSHSHGRPEPNFNRAFAIGVVLNLVFVGVEATYGILTDSLVLVADAGHNLSDVFSLFLAWGASVLAARKPTPRYSYGYRRATILASLVSAVMLLIVLGLIAWEAAERFRSPLPVDGWTVVVVAGIGVVINTATALMFLSGRKDDLNIRAAYLHMAADAAVSLGVVVSGFVILNTGWMWLDPSMSLIIVGLILIGTWALLRDSVSLALDSVPNNIDPLAVETFLARLPNVARVHDLHIWGMSTTEVALTAHLIVPEVRVDDSFLNTVAASLHDRFGIGHATLQIERGDGDRTCHLEQPDSV